MTRRINPDAMAIRYALQCSILTVRRPAMDYVVQTIRAHRGHCTGIVEHLGVGRRTFERWLNDYPELAKVYDSYKDRGTTGPLPNRLK